MDGGENDGRADTLECSPRSARAKALRALKLHQLGESLAMLEEARASPARIVKNLRTFSTFALHQICVGPPTSYNASKFDVSAIAAEAVREEFRTFSMAAFNSLSAWPYILAPCRSN